MESEETEEKMEELPPMLMIEAALFSAGKPVGLDEIGRPADELEIARTDVGHGVPDDFAQLGHDRR